MTLQSPLSLPSNPQPDLFTDTMNMADSHVANIVNEILVCFTLYGLQVGYNKAWCVKYLLFQRVEAVEEAFSCFLVHKPEQENERLSMYQKKLCAVMTTLSTDLQESAIRQYLTLTAVLTNRYKMKQLLTLLENLVNTNILQARSAFEFF